MGVAEFIGLVVSVAAAVKGGVDAKRDYDKRQVAEQAAQVIREAEASINKMRDDAKRANDQVAAARAQALASELAAIRRRTNIHREIDKVEAASARFRSKGADGWFQGETYGGFMDALEGIVGKELSEVGKLLHASASWSSMEESADKMRMLYGRLLEHRDGYVALPDQVGDYLARETYRRILRDNPQLAGMPGDEVFAVVCEWSKDELGKQARRAGSNEDAEIIFAAREKLCTKQAASGTLDFVDDLHALNRWLPQRQLRMSFTQGAEVTGTVEIEVDVPQKDMTALVQGVAEAAAGAASAGALGAGGKGKSKVDEIRCSARGNIVLRLDGTHDGERTMKGGVSLVRDRSQVRVICDGKTELADLSKVGRKGFRRFTATESGESVKADVEFGQIHLRGTISRR